jgi:hypothetical protein
MSEEINKTLSQVEDIFKSVVWDNLIQVALAALFAYAPFLALPVLKPVISYIITMFSDKLFSAAKLAIDLEAIVLINESHKKAYANASVALKIIAHSKGIGSPEFLEARENAKKSFAKFIAFNVA